MERYWKRNLVVIATGAFIASLGFNLNTPFISLFVQQELGQTDNVAFLASLALSASSLMYAIMAPVWGSLADKHGKKTMFIRAGIGIAIANLLMALAQNYGQYLLLRFLNGTLSGFIPACTMFIASNMPERRVGFALGINQSAISIGTIMGPAIGGYLAEIFGMRLAMGLVALFVFLASLLCIFGSKEITASDKTRKTDVLGDLKSVLKVPTLRGVIFALLMVNMALTIIQPVLTLYIQQLVGEDGAKVVSGFVYSIIGVSTALGAPLISYLHTLRAPKKVFYYGLGAAAVLYVIQGLTTNVYLLGGERFLFGFANSAVTITANVLVTMSAPPEMRGRTFGALNGISSLGNVVGPILGGSLGDALGYNVPFFVGGILFLGALVFSVSSLKDVENAPLPG